MAFNHTLDRLRDAASQHPTSPEQRGLRPGRRIVGWRDLAELLRDHDRLDAAARLGYPPHIDALVDAATIALTRLPPGEVSDRLRHAVHMARPPR
jgi:hypothetical protein